MSFLDNKGQTVYTPTQQPLHQGQWVNTNDGWKIWNSGSGSAH